MEFLKITFIYESILHKACQSGNIDLLKYLISLKEIDINVKNIFIFSFFFMTFYYIFFIAF